ncbi:hypothetical protein JCM8547_005323 [Rhodosporidiobolus lusitaniae]
MEQGTLGRAEAAWAKVEALFPSAGQCNIETIKTTRQLAEATRSLRSLQATQQSGAALTALRIVQDKERKLEQRLSELLSGRGAGAAELFLAVEEAVRMMDVLQDASYIRSHRCSAIPHIYAVHQRQRDACKRDLTLAREAERAALIRMRVIEPLNVQRSMGRQSGSGMSGRVEERYFGRSY